MNTRKLALWASTALVGSLLSATGAWAQSTGTLTAEDTEVEAVVVSGQRGPRTTDGTIVAETVAKTRSTITQEYIETQSPGQTILQSLNLVPGLNFVNNDPYGNSGGNVRLRGFDGNRISLTFDGIPLNDTGNYAIFTNQQLDPELIERASVNQGTTDVDSPTASATGGTINYTTARPLVERGGQIVGSLGEDNYRRIFGRYDVGAFGPLDTTAYLTASYTNYDKFKGPGELEKQQYNGRVFQNLGDNNFGSLAFNWNVNRNDFYNNFITQAQFNSGNFLENDIACLRPLGVDGTTQDENTQAARTLSDGSTATGSCTNYHGLRINPSNTGSVRGQFSYGLTDNIRVTFDPSFQYVIANGGGFTLIQERDDRLDQNPANNNSATSISGISSAQCTTAAFRTTGADLNGDGDTCDNVGLYTPSNTNTHRYGLLSSLIWDLNDDHRLRGAYTFDYGRHRQTGEATRFQRNSEPIDVFAGQERWGEPGERVFGRDGSFYRSRDRFSIAALNQIAGEYRGQFLDDALTVNIGARAPFFRRELDQRCYSQNASSTVRCTTETPVATLANGNVRFASTGTTQWIPPYEAEFEFDDVLPNAGITWRFGGGNTVYASYAEGLSAPRTDNLYQPARAADGSLDFSAAVPETTRAYDLGYRFSAPTVIASAAVWYINFENRIVSSFDADPDSPFFGQSIDRNVGAVEQMGLDAQVGWEATDILTLYASASYNDSELQDDLQLSATTFLPTRGKKLVETPDWTYAFRTELQVTEALSMGLQAKHVGERFATDVNDETAPSYTVFDFDARYELTNLPRLRDVYVQLNVTNLFDEDYLGNISTGNNSTTIDVLPGPGVVLRSGLTRTYSIGAPRTAMITLGTRF